MCVTETWLKPKHSKIDVHITDYQLFRRDRVTDTVGGGIAIYVHEAILSKRRLLNAPWNILDKVDDVDDAVDFFEQIFMKCVTSNIPSKLVTIRPRDKPWFTSEVRKQFKTRDRLHKQWKNKPSQKNYDKFKLARGEANQAKFNAKSDYYTKISIKLTDPTTSSKEYWKLIKQLYGNKVHKGIPPIIKDGKVHSSSESKCNIFNKTFTDKYKLPPNKPIIPPVQYITDSTLDHITTNEEDVHRHKKPVDQTI